MSNETEPLVKAESRAFEHKYFIRRPRDARATFHREEELRELQDLHFDVRSKDDHGVAVSSRAESNSTGGDQKENVEALKGLAP